MFAQFTDLQFADQYALAFSMPSLHGNARFVGMGGAFGALGANLSALSTNPAGIGLYRRGEFSFTPTLALGQTEVRQVDGINSPLRFNDRMNFNVMNFGMVNVWDISRSDNPNEWKMVQFGFGVNRQADFWNRSSYTGFVDWTYLDELTDGSNDWGSPRGTVRYVARRAGLIFHDTSDGVFSNALWGFDQNTGWYHYGGLTQHQSTETRGGINEWFMTFGGNYGDVLYLGATIGMPVVSFRQTRTLHERDDAGIHRPYFDYWRLRETLEVNGTGVNLKLGAIVRPTDFMRIGLAFHTPTRYALRENLTIEASGAGTLVNSRGHTERLDQFEYNLRTPMRLVGSLGFVIGRQALIGIEYEHLNFRNMRLTGDDPQFDLDNDFIRDNYRTGGVFRVGGEFRIDPVNIRIGYNYTISPFDTESRLVGRNFSGHTLSAGLGFVLGSTTIDIAYVNSFRRFDMQPYSNMPVPTNTMRIFEEDPMPWNRYNVSAQQFMITLGWRF